MNAVVEEKEYQLKSRQQVRSMIKELLSGSLLILAVGILIYLLLFILMLLI